MRSVASVLILVAAVVTSPGCITEGCACPPGVGVGVQVPDDFDRFEPVSPSSVVLIIDDLQNIEFVNWT